jgi:multidrug efflux pump
LKSNTRNTLDLSDYAENVIGQQLITIPGVSTVQIWGQRKYAMRLRFDPIRSWPRTALTVVDVRNALDRENIELPAGKIAGDKTELVVRTTGLLRTEEDFNNMIIVNNGDQLIRFRDLGIAELGPENEETILRQSGTPMIGVALVPQPGSNYIDIADEFYNA